MKLNPTWPVIKSYEGDYCRRVAMPLGGIGTGCVAISGRGHLRDFELVNRPALGFDPGANFFTLRAKAAGKSPVMRRIEGELSAHDVERGDGRIGPFPWGLPRFRHARFDGAYPLGQVTLSDPEMPLRVRLEAFNPFIPGDAERSGLPVAVLRYVLVNPTSKPVSATVAGTMRNFIGQDGAGTERQHVKRNRLRKAQGLCGIEMGSADLDRRDATWGTLVLATTARSGISYRTGWNPPRFGTEVIDFWDDLLVDGKLDQRRGDPGIVSLAVKVSVPARGEKAITFLYAWHFPNRITWSPRGGGPPGCSTTGRGDLPHPEDVIGNYYTTRFRSAWHAAVKTAAQLRTLEADTVTYVRAFVDSDLPGPIKDAALSTTAVLKTQTCFRTPDGRFYGFEGCGEKEGCALGSCTHVWNYEQTTAHLFAELSRSMREIEFAHATPKDGSMSFRVLLPLALKATEFRTAAADGQMGCLVKLYRDWKLSGDDRLLRNLWPGARRAMRFAWVKGGWDADRDGVMEGCQHNTYDVEFFGPSPLTQVWYLGALRAAEEMAAYLGDETFAATCRELFERGSTWTDQHLFNGEFYEQMLQTPKTRSVKKVLTAGMGARDLKDPDFQAVGGCLIDQLLGQNAAHVAGLGLLLKRSNIKKTMRSIMRYNFRSQLHGHFNFFRSYALNDDSGTLMCSYPRGKRPGAPFPFADEVWSGCEYALAALMIYEGMHSDALKVIKAARDRHDGLRRNPYDEPEAGRFYARPMSSWATLIAWTGFGYDGRSGELTFAASGKPVTWFWSTGDAWGTVHQKGKTVTVEVLFGALKLRIITITGKGSARTQLRGALKAGKSLRVTV